MYDSRRWVGIGIGYRLNSGFANVLRGGVALSAIPTLGGGFLVRLINNYVFLYQPFLSH